MKIFIGLYLFCLKIYKKFLKIILNFKMVLKNVIVFIGGIGIGKSIIIKILEL